jgi:EmrB/QacA subfamily drug resistance transporter
VADGPPSRRVPPWAALAATCLGQFMVVLDATIVNVALPAMRRGLHLSATDLQWVINAYLLTLGGLILLGGRLGDHFGRKRVYLIGGLIFSTASLAGGVAPNGGVLLAARAVQGVGAALLAPGTLSLLTSVYTERRARTRALAVWSTTTASGGALGVFLGGALTDVLGWRSVLFVNVPLGVLVLVLGGMALPAMPRRVGPAKRLDVPGALAVTAALTALVYGVVETESHPWGSTRTLLVLAVAVALLVITAAIESRASNALIPFAILRRGPVATATTMMVIHGAVMTAAIYFQSLYLQQVRGFSPFDTGLLLMPFALLAIATPVFSSQVATRYGPRRVALVSIVVETAGIVWLSRWGAHGSILTQVVFPSMVVGLGASICFFSMSVLLTSEIEREHSGLGSGLFNAGRQVGGSIGLAALTVVAAAHTRSLLASHHGALAQATARGYGVALLAGAGLLVVGIVVIATHANRRRLRTAAPVDAEGRPAELPSH